MKNRIAIVGLLLVASIAVFIWWKHGQDSDPDATPEVTQPTAPVKPVVQPPKPPAKPAHLTVVVENATGPLTGAAVRIAPADGDVVVLATDARGTARLDVAPGEYAISASAADHEPAAAGPSVELAAGSERTVSIKLVAGGKKLAGTVTDATGGPIAGVRIDAAKLGGTVRPDAAIATATTGADGKYSLTVAEGRLLVAARSPDYAPQSRYVEVGASGATADFALVPGGVIEGVVLDDKTKQPVAGARVDASRDSPAMMLAESGGHHTIASGDGRFRLSGLRPGVYDLGARADRLRSKAPTLVGIGVAEQVTDVQLLVGAGATVRGKVLDETGTTVAGADVMSVGERGGPDTKSDATGTFVLDGMPPGKLALLARSDAHVAAGLTSVEVIDKDVDGVVVRVQRGLKVKGHVEPRQVTEVEIEPDEHAGRPMFIAPVTTAADGEFEIGPLLPGNATLSGRTRTGDAGTLAVAVAPNMEPVILKVTPGASIAGRVIDAEGKPVANASVMATAQGPTERTMIVNGVITSGIQALTTATGTYELRGLAAGTYRLAVLERGRPLRMRKQVPAVKVAAAEKKTGVELAVDRPDGVIRGVVTGPDGKPLADAWVSLTQDIESIVESAAGRGDDDNGPGGRMITVQARDDGDGGDTALPPALTDAQGRFEIGGLPHARFDVVAEAQAGKLRGRADNVTPDANLTIQALGVTSLSGTVTSPSGPPALFTVELDGATRAQRTFTGGTFSLGRVDPGNYTVRVSSSDGNAEVKVTVAPNTPATVDIMLVANAIVVGRLVDPDGKPLANVGVTVIDDAGDGQVRIAIEGPPPASGPDGTFRVEHKAGRGILVVLTPPRPITRKGLVLEAGKTLDVGSIRVERAEPPQPPK